MDCTEARKLLAVGDQAADLASHVDGCPACAGYAHRQRALDTALRPELMLQAPAELTLRLMLLVPGNVAVRVPPKRWYVLLVYVLTVAAIAVSTAVAFQFYSLLATQVGLAEALVSLRAAPAAGLHWLYTTLPQSRYVVTPLLALRDQLHWVLLVLLMWAALDRARPAQAAEA